MSMIQGYSLLIFSPDNVNSIAADINISPERKRRDIKAVEDEMAWDRANWAYAPDFKQEPMRTIQFGEFSGLVYTRTISNAWAANPVTYKQTRVYYDTPGGPYSIGYNAPVALYDKYHPRFERVLKTFRWTAGAKASK